MVTERLKSMLMVSMELVAGYGERGVTLSLCVSQDLPDNGSAQ